MLNGKATVRRGADIRGDVASRTAPTAARNTVRGHVQRLDVNSLFAGFVVVILAVLWVAVTLSTAVLGLLFGHAIRGLAIGAAAGGGYVLATQGKDVELPAQTGLKLRLDSNLAVPASRP